VAGVRLQSVQAVAADGTEILRNVNLDVRDGELMVIVGQSGAGKTSVIRAVAGLDHVTSGSVLFGGVDVTQEPTGQRDVGMVFQEAALFPKHTARNNIGFGLRIRKIKKPTIRQRVDAEARALGITKMMERWPHELSAGHQQLVQIARAMVRVPKVLLLDEPMAHVDPPTRARLRSDLKELQRGYGLTTILATNDADEAMAMADTIAAIEDGTIVQSGPPTELYARPANVQIASFTGRVRFVGAYVESASEGFWLVGDGFRIRAWPPELGRFVGRGVNLGIRPEDVRVQPSSPTTAVIERQSFESGSPSTMIRLGRSTILMPAVEEPDGSVIGITIDRLLVFDDSDQLITHVGDR
jgi:multiple sugar transport system ATP-binding protein